MSSAAPRVSLTSTASICGKTVWAKHSKKPVYAFLGVPYATPPVGRLRFKAPRPFTPDWRGDKDAKEYGPICPQNIEVITPAYYPFKIPTNVSEDCLYLNVWTPALDQTAKLPVMVWIHGGAFLSGFSNFYDGSALASLHNVVCISINYRLGPLGFLCTGDEFAEGNAGLLDQLESLRWIQKYIQLFGGDPSNVTIFGESAGGISVSLHLVSDLAKGLFRRAISESGVIYPGCVWKRENAKKYLLNQLNKMGCNTKDKDEMQSFLLSCSANTLVYNCGEGFNAVLDGNYLKDMPHNLHAKGLINPVDYLLGFNSDEGAQFVFFLMMSETVPTREIGQEMICKILKTAFYRGVPNIDKLCDIVCREYLPSHMTDITEITKAVCDFYGDVLFMGPINAAAARHCEIATTYMYLFNHRPGFSKLPKWVTADHAQEIAYVLGFPFTHTLPNVWKQEDYDLSQLMMNYWVNFAKNGNPNGSSVPEWPEFDRRRQEYMIFEKSPRIGAMYNPARIQFWNETVPHVIKHGQAKL